jgi:hypothetical protein
MRLAYCEELLANDNLATATRRQNCGQGHRRQEVIADASQHRHTPENAVGVGFCSRIAEPSHGAP